MEINSGHPPIKDDLSATEKELFQQTMKKSVWVIKIKLSNSMCDWWRLGEVKPLTSFHAGGVCVHPDGLIVSVADIFPEKDFNIFGSLEDREYVEERTYALKLVAIDKSVNLVLLRCEVEGGEKFNYCKFSDYKDPYFPLGQNVFSVCHANSMLYSLATGLVSYSDRLDYRRRVKHDLMSMLEVNSDHLPPMDYDEKLDVIQILGFPTRCTGVYGCPVFEITGKVIGLVSFCSPDFVYAINLHVLKTFYMKEKFYMDKRATKDKNVQKRKRKGQT